MNKISPSFTRLIPTINLSFSRFTRILRMCGINLLLLHRCSNGEGPNGTHKDLKKNATQHNQFGAPNPTIRIQIAPWATPFPS